MAKDTCDICGHKSDFWSAQKQPIVPTKITRQANIPDSVTMELCNNCIVELNTWYPKKVYNVGYNNKSKRFERKSPVEMVQEYKAAFMAFVEYKKRQQKTHQ
jgi:hypothetical protein